MNRILPFKGILGHTKELDVIEFLTAEPYDYYDISELADILEINRNTVSRIIKKFTSFDLLQFTAGKGRSKCFRLNGFSKIIQSIDILSAGIIDETSKDLNLFETTLIAFLPKAVELIQKPDDLEYASHNGPNITIPSGTYAGELEFPIKNSASTKSN